eukprot:6269093-Prymnesium_polylepis.1
MSVGENASTLVVADVGGLGQQRKHSHPAGPLDGQPRHLVDPMRPREEHAHPRMAAAAQDEAHLVQLRLEESAHGRRLYGAAR